MSERWILVDGYSVLHAWPKLRRAAGRSLEQQRDALVRVLQRFADSTRDRGVRRLRRQAETERNGPTPELKSCIPSPQDGGRRD
jgi:hypothetical protein